MVSLRVQVVAGGVLAALVSAAAVTAALAAIGASADAPGWARPTVLALGAAAVLAPLALGAWLGVRCGGPVRDIAGLLSAAAAGDLTGRAGSDVRGPLAPLARDFDRMADAVGGGLGEIGEDVLAVSAAMEELSVATGQIEQGVAGSSREASAVAAAAQQVSTNVQAVAAATEQMSASIREIAANTSAGATVAVEAVGAVETASATVAKLGESSSQIGEVVKLITQIAEQTNLLALNATIEAARAGESGKGFAVVASEVKDLAQETARATEDIGGRIDAIQADVRDASAAIGRITTVIDQLSESQSAVAGALEEQTSVTQEMSRSVSEAATGVESIAESIALIAVASEGSTEAVGDTLEAQAEVARMTGGLTGLLGGFTFVAPDPTSLSASRQITRAIGAHGAWKRRLGAAVRAGRHDEDVATVGRDDACDFGRWLAGAHDGGSRGHVEAARGQHAAFHRAAADVLRQVSAGRRAEAQAAIEPGGAFAESSRVLTATMIAWRRAVTQG
jgi:methyl-accepting chemotaxis protein